MSVQYLSDTHCNLLNNKMKKAFFSKLDKVSLRHWNPSFKVEADSLLELKPKVPILTPIVKAKIMSNRVREVNRSTLRKRSNNQMKATIDTVKNKVNIKEYLSQSERKISLPKLVKKSISIGNDIQYQTKYIDKIENYFINPYLKNQNKSGNYYIQNKKSKIPFNFKPTKD